MNGTAHFQYRSNLPVSTGDENGVHNTHNSATIVQSTGDGSPSTPIVSTNISGDTNLSGNSSEDERSLRSRDCKTSDSSLVSVSCDTRVVDMCGETGSTNVVEDQTKESTKTCVFVDAECCDDVKVSNSEPARISNEHASIALQIKPPPPRHVSSPSSTLGSTKSNNSSETYSAIRAPPHYFHHPPTPFRGGAAAPPVSSTSVAYRYPPPPLHYPQPQQYHHHHNRQWQHNNINGNRHPRLPFHVRTNEAGNNNYFHHQYSDGYNRGHNNNHHRYNQNNIRNIDNNSYGSCYRYRNNHNEASEPRPFHHRNSYNDTDDTSSLSECDDLSANNARTEAQLLSSVDIKTSAGVFDLTTNRDWTKAPTPDEMEQHTLDLRVQVEQPPADLHNDQESQHSDLSRQLWQLFHAKQQKNETLRKKHDLRTRIYNVLKVCYMPFFLFMFIGFVNYMYVYVCVCFYLCLFVCVFMYVFVCVYVCVSLRLSPYLYERFYIWCVCVLCFLRLCRCVYVCLDSCTFSVCSNVLAIATVECCNIHVTNNSAGL